MSAVLMAGTLPRRRTTTPASVYLLRRLAALAVLVTLVATVLGAWSLTSQAADPAPGLAASVVVAPGETVWDIASDYLPEGASTHAYVAEVLAHNDLDAASVTPGAVLQLPRP